MMIITKEIAAKLDRNAVKAKTHPQEVRPVLKLFCPWGAATWLISERDPKDPDMLFGLCDLGLGEAELGYVYLPELMALRGPGGLTIERDRWFEADMPLATYAARARQDGRIVA